VAEKFKGASFSDWLYEQAQFPSLVQLLQGKMVELARSLIGQVPIPNGDIANAGNLSCRTAEGCLITRTGCSIVHLDANDWIEVISWNPDTWIPTAKGPAPNEPSSEIGAHLAIYKARPDVNVIVHLHSREFVAWARTLGAPLTEEEYPYGTPEFVAEIIKVLEDHNLVCLCGPEHIGFFALGGSISEVKELIRSSLAKIKEAKFRQTPTNKTCRSARQ